MDTERYHYGRVRCRYAYRGFTVSDVTLERSDNKHCDNEPQHIYSLNRLHACPPSPITPPSTTNPQTCTATLPSPSKPALTPSPARHHFISHPTPWAPNTQTTHPRPSSNYTSPSDRSTHCHTSTSTDNQDLEPPRKHRQQSPHQLHRTKHAREKQSIRAAHPYLRGCESASDCGVCFVRLSVRRSFLCVDVEESLEFGGGRGRGGWVYYALLGFMPRARRPWWWWTKGAFFSRAAGAHVRVGWGAAPGRGRPLGAPLWWSLRGGVGLGDRLAGVRIADS